MADGNAAGRRAMYAGSFDPVTNGHLDVIERGAALFEEVVVAVGNNPAKRYLFGHDERVGLMTRAIRAPNVRVVPFTGLLVDAARDAGAGVLLRGLRGVDDFAAEFRYGLANRDLTGVETLFLLAAPAHMHLSSSIVKEIAQYGGDISRYVPAEVAARVREALALPTQ